jgi:ABC-2 type transport system permease protein
MPVEDRGYRRREPRGELRRFRAVPIARETLRQILGRRVLLLFLSFSFVPFALWGIAVLLASRVQLPEGVSMLAPAPSVLLNYLKYPQALFAILFAVWAGSGLIADDLRTGALLMYLSRPLTRVDYILGKLGVLTALTFVVTAVPPLVLWGLAVALEPHDLAKRGLATIPLATIVAGATLAIVLSVIVGGASAITRSGAMAGLLVVGAMVFFGALAATPAAGALPALKLLSILGDWSALCDGLFGAPQALPHWTAALGALLLVAAGAGSVLWRRVRAVDIVG